MSELLGEIWYGRYEIVIVPKDGIRGYKDVRVTLFREYDDMSKTEATMLLQECGFNYDPYLASYVEQTFSLDEMLELVKYFAIVGPEVEIRVHLAHKPKGNIMGVSAIAVGGHDDIIELWNKDTYYLAFKVSGYFDLRTSPEWGKDPERKHETVTIDLSKAQLVIAGEA